MAVQHITFSDLRLGMRWTFRRDITASDHETTMALTGDQGGYHVDQRFARAAGFRTTIAPGLLAASMFTKLGGDLNYLAREMVFNFHRPVYVGDRLEAVIEIVEIDPERRLAVFEGTITNQDGEQVLTCRSTGHVPPEDWGVPEKPAPHFP